MMLEADLRRAFGGGGWQQQARKAATPLSGANLIFTSTYLTYYSLICV